jgi:hypothetical protein
MTTEGAESGGFDAWRFVRASLIIALILIVSAFAFDAGLRIRRWAWDYSQGAHFRGDVNNAFYWGQQSDTFGLFHVYDAVDDGRTPDPNKKLDYPPLRLVMATLWERWTVQHFPGATEWIDDYGFTLPMLRLNTMAETASCILIFFLIRLWRIRYDNARRRKDHPPALFRGVAPGMIGALLFWFNPAIIWDGHCWPQWDVWPIPFFVAAVLLASVDFWMPAGVCLAIGASLKGQLLLAAPVMLIWPIVRLQFGRAIELVAGFVLTTTLIALPFMHPDPAAWRWIAAALIALVCIAPIVFRVKLRTLALVVLAVISLLSAWPWEARGLPWQYRLIPLGILALTVPWRFFGLRLRVAAFALALSGLILLLMPLFNASSNWFTYGFEFGTTKFGFMTTGSGSYNIPRMMMVYLQWPDRPTDLVTVPFIAAQITFTTLTRIVYAFTLLLCGIGAAIQDRRRDPRFLIAMSAPWLLFFLILTQMHGRYTIWAAGLTALMAGAGVGVTLLGILVTLVSLLGIIHNQLLFSRDWSPDTLSTLQGLDPSLGWILVLVAGIYLYLAVMPRIRD